ncbi:DUF2865 domain-containing protein [Lichenibacterium dinghuense]|uniref:DUF2865 domain-containing protein n=1 Tax=Lichenibacterium dinghuense TaxID=2895977 RepID=UPI001F226D65|nr:DUF2865 domain-containing protein [Lichenibacterium sp. 6Y81]
MTRPGPRRLPASALALAAALSLLPRAATAQAVDCSALRAAIDAAGAPADPAEADAAMRRQRDEILRARDDANRTGCGDGFFDDPDSAPCRALARRIGLLQVGLQRMQDRAAARDDGGADDDRRRDLQARFDAQCTADPAPAGDGPVEAVPVDPDAPAGPAAKPRASRVLCVRHCDGAFYPLAVDVASDRMADMDRICQAQCPAAEASAYAGGDGDVAGATATDGSPYSALPAAFGYLKGPAKSCACRAPHQSWAEALAGAEALLQPHKGDVTVTAELAAAMARPTATVPKPVPSAAKPSTPAPPPSKRAKAKPVPLPAAPAPPAALDLTREFRGSDPTL